MRPRAYPRVVKPSRWTLLAVAVTAVAAAVLYVLDSSAVAGMVRDGGLWWRNTPGFWIAVVALLPAATIALLAAGGRWALVPWAYGLALLGAWWWYHAGDVPPIHPLFGIVMAGIAVVLGYALLLLAFGLTVVERGLRLARNERHSVPT